MISFIFIIIIIIVIIIIIIVVVVIIIIIYVSFRSITMQNLEVVASKLAELWPFNDFSKIITDSLTDSCGKL
jgi:ABC-type maltose transport system permease subunit